MSVNGTPAHTSSGYDYDRAALTKLLDRFRLPERSTAESAVLADFLAAHVSEYSDFNFTVRVGQGRTPDPTHLPGIQQQTVQNSRLRIDMIGWQGDQPTLFEVKLRANHHAIGQLRTYRQLWQQEHPDALEPRLAVIARTIEPDMEDVFAAEGITVYLFEPTDAGGSAAGGGVPPRDGQAA